MLNVVRGQCVFSPWTHQYASHPWKKVRPVSETKYVLLTNAKSLRALIKESALKDMP
jgi:hypothetical protein